MGVIEAREEPIARAPHPGAQEFLAALLASGLLVDGGAPGIFHRSATYEVVVAAVSSRFSEVLGCPGRPRLQISPVQPLPTLERTGYVTSFPQLIGVISGFPDADERPAEVLGWIEGAGDDWAKGMTPTNLSLCGAACHGAYPTMARTTLTDAGTYLEVEAWCFRREPSADPARLQSFRMCEQVFVGTPADAVAQRDRWLDEGLALLRSFGLEASTTVASDPFFGRPGRLYAEGQRARELKFEILAPVSCDDLLAIASSNYHEDHFGVTFDVRTPDGEPAHSACVGFGLDRVTLALLRRHGLDPTSWPERVRSALRLCGAAPTPR